MFTHVSAHVPLCVSPAGARSLEEAVVHAVVEARRAAPAVLFLPHLQVRAASACRHTVLLCLSSVCWKSSQQATVCVGVGVF